MRGTGAAAPPGRIVLLGANGWIGGRFAQGTAAVPLPAADVLTEGLAAVLGRHRQRALGPDDVVVNAAGARQGQPKHLRAWNAQLPEMLAASCRAAGAFLVHLGSAAELGAGSQQPDAPPLAEDAAAAPQTPYAETKWLGTQAALTGGFCVLRLFNVVDDPPQPGMPTSDILARVRQTAPHQAVTVINAETQRDFVSRGYVAESVATAASRRIPGLFHICSGVPIRVADLVVSLAEHLGVPIAGVNSERPEPNRVLGDPRRWYLSTGLRETLTTDELAALLVGGAELRSDRRPPPGGRE